MTATAIPQHRTPQSRRLMHALAYYAAYIILGTMLAAMGPTLPALGQQTGSTLSQISILFTANSLGYIGGSLVGSRLYDRRPGQPILMVTLLAMSCLTFLIPMVANRWLLVSTFLLIGIGMGVLDVGGNTLIVWLFGRDVGPYMNALHLSFGLGALLSPILVDQMVALTGGIRAAYWLLSALMIPVAVWMIRIPSPERPGRGQSEPFRPLNRAHYMFVAFIAIFFFLHVGAELSFGGWVFSYASALQIGPQTTARLLNSLFWGGLTLGRLIAIPLAVRLSPAIMLLIDLLGAAVSLGLVFLLPDWPPSLWIGTGCFGFFVASMFPSTINYVEKRMPITGRVTGIFLVGANAGSMTLPWVVGQLFEPVGPGSLIVVVGVAIITGIGLFAAMQVYTGRVLANLDPVEVT